MACAKGKTTDSVIDANAFAVDFQFGCQDAETGLFRTQNIDGIMGMSADRETLPYYLHKNNITSTKAFALCFHHGGGMLTLGGVDQTVHTDRSSSGIKFARLVKSSGWFTVKMLNILMRTSSGDKPQLTSIADIGHLQSACNSNKGTIVDSGSN